MDEEDGPMATVNFHLRYKTNFGQGVKLIGSDPKLGECIGLACKHRTRATAGVCVHTVQLGFACLHNVNKSYMRGFSQGLRLSTVCKAQEKCACSYL
eukprot:1145853-Pelagomonas_calceolata.AAC.3